MVLPVETVTVVAVARDRAERKSMLLAIQSARLKYGICAVIRRPEN
jgi:hypothetical protein